MQVFIEFISLASTKLHNQSIEIEYFHQFISFHKFIDEDKNFLCSCEHNDLITSSRNKINCLLMQAQKSFSFMNRIEANEKLIFLLISWETQTIAQYQIEQEKLHKLS